MTQYSSLYAKDLKTIKRLKLILDTGSALSKWKKSANASRNRYNRLKELITTEEDYYNDLSTLQEKIKSFLITNKMITKTVANEMFKDIENFMLFSKEMKRGLMEKL